MDTLNTAFNFTAADADGVVLAEHRIRVIILDGAPWFVAADVCRALGVYVYGGKPNVREATRKLGGDEVRTEGVNPMHPLGMDPRAKSVTLISESGLYKLIMRSDKPTAGPFQEWVTREVLPAIRRTGGYRLAGVAPEAVEEGTVAEMHKSRGPRSPMQTASISRLSLKRDNYVKVIVTQA